MSDSDAAYTGYSQTAWYTWDWKDVNATTLDMLASVFRDRDDDCGYWTGGSCDAAED